MKVERHGQARILSWSEIQLLFNEGLTKDRDRTLFGVCLYTACRIAEACSLKSVDTYEGERVRSLIILRKSNTKGKRATRQVAPHPDLVKLLAVYHPEAGKVYLFPGRHGRGHIHPTSADAILRIACERVGLTGVSTHSFRRTMLTSLSSNGTPLAVIQKISGHTSLGALQAYLEVSDEQVAGAIRGVRFS